MHLRLPTLALLAIAGLAASSSALADPLFAVNATGGGASINATGSNVIDLVQNVVQTQDQFSGLAGTDVSANLTYAGVPNALKVTVNAAGTSATLSGLGIPTQTFTGTSQDDLQNQITDWMKKDGAKAMADFIKEINKRSMAAIVDGNPSAQTALTAQHSFGRWGGSQGGNLRESKDGLYSNANVTYTDYKLDNFKSNIAGVDLSLGYRFSETIALFNTFSGAYQTTEEAKIGRASDELALSIAVYNDNDLKAEITPLAMLGGAASADMANGGLFWGVGVAGHLGYTIIPGLTLGAGVQYVKDQGISPITVGDYTFETHVDQAVLSYGVDAAWEFADKLQLTGGVAQHQLLNDAAQADWITPTIGLRWGRTTTLEVGYEGVISSKVNGNGGLVRFGFLW